MCGRHAFESRSRSTCSSKIESRFFWRKPRAEYSTWSAKWCTMNAVLEKRGLAKRGCVLRSIKFE